MKCALLWDSKCSRKWNALPSLSNWPHFPVATKLRLFGFIIAEYEACIACLKATLGMNVKDLDVYGDSTLIINQSTGKWVVGLRN